MSWSRRRFLNTTLSSSTLVAMGATTDPDISRSFGGGRPGGKINDRILVVVQLLGGNDGLNTVVPHGIDGYNRGARPPAARRATAQDHREIGSAPRDGRRWPRCSRAGGWRSCRGSAIPTRTGRTSDRWRSGRRPA